MKAQIWGWLAITLIGACSPTADPRLAKRIELKDKVCACTDKKCVDLVLDDSLSYNKLPKKPDEPRDDDMARRTEAVDAEIARCLTKVTMASTPR